MAKDLKVQLNSQSFDGSDPTPILTFLAAFQIACDTIGIHKSAATRQFHVLKRMPAGAALSACSWQYRSGRLCQEGKLACYYQVVSYLLMTYTIDDIIAEADVKIPSLKLPGGQNAVEYA